MASAAGITSSAERKGADFSLTIDGAKQTGSRRPSHPVTNPIWIAFNNTPANYCTCAVGEVSLSKSSCSTLKSNRGTTRDGRPGRSLARNRAARRIPWSTMYSYGTFCKIKPGLDDSGSIVMTLSVVDGEVKVEHCEPKITGASFYHPPDLQPLSEQEKKAYFVRDTLREASRSRRPVVVLTSLLGGSKRYAGKRVKSVDFDSGYVKLTGVVDDVSVELAVIEKVDYDYDTEKAERDEQERKARHEVAAAYRVISQALNSGVGLDGLRDELGREHSTLLGKLTNEVLGAVDARDGDLRLSSFHTSIDRYGDHSGDLRVSEIRQGLI